MKRLLAGLLVAAVMVGYLIHRAGTRELWDCLIGVRLPILCLAELLLVAVMYVKAARWATTTRAAVPRPLYGAFGASLIGFAGNLVVPARLGELARVHVFARRNDISRSLALTTLGLTQLIDLLALGIYFLCLTLWSGRTVLLNRGLLLAMLVGTVACLTLLLLAGRRGQLLPSAARLIGKRLPEAFTRRFTGYAEQFVTGLQLFSDYRLSALVALQTLAVWILETSILALALLAFRIPLNPLMPPLLVVVLNLGFAVPMTPGNLGPHQLLSVLVLRLFNIPEAQALSFSIGYQGVSTALMLSLGGISFLRQGLWGSAAILEPEPAAATDSQEVQLERTPAA